MLLVGVILLVVGGFSFSRMSAPDEVNRDSRTVMIYAVATLLRLAVLAGLVLVLLGANSWYRTRHQEEPTQPPAPEGPPLPSHEDVPERMPVPSPNLPIIELLALATVPEEHSLPDGLIQPTDEAGWDRFLAMLAASSWRLELQDEPIDRALTFDDVVAGEERRTLHVWLDEDIQINVFPDEAEAIMFDFATQDLVDQTSADILADFIRKTGQAVGQRVDLSVEGDMAKIFATYAPETDEFFLG